MAAKTVDIGSKRLISLAPTRWARWLTDDPTVEAMDVVSGEFQWVSRANDVLIKARSQRHGAFLIANEIQFRADAEMPRRMRAYAALAEERYGLNVYPVVVNILPGGAGASTPESYHSEFMGLIAHQDYKIVNLWEVDAALVFEQQWSTLLPFVPVLRGGDSPFLLRKALALLRADEQLSEMETLLAFFSTFVLTPEEVMKIMRWDMAILRESPWYSEIVKEGLEEGLQQGLQQGRLEERAEVLMRIIERRFGTVPPELALRLRVLGAEQLYQLVDVALTAATLDMVMATLNSLPPDPHSGDFYLRRYDVKGSRG